MLKKILLCLLTVNYLFAVEEKEQSNPFKKFLIGGIVIGLVVAGSTVAAPAAAVASTCCVPAASTVGVVGSFVCGPPVTAISNIALAGSVANAITVAAPVAAKTNGLVAVARYTAPYVRPLVAPTEEENLKSLQRQEVNEVEKSRSALKQCLLKNNFHKKKKEKCCPRVCQEIAAMFCVMAGKKELDQTIKSIIH